MQGPAQKQFEIKSQFLRSFFEFLTTYETQKNDAFFSVLFLRTEKNAKKAMFFCKEHKRTQRTFWKGGNGVGVDGRVVYWKAICIVLCVTLGWVRLG